MSLCPCGFATIMFPTSWAATKGRIVFHLHIVELSAAFRKKFTVKNSQCLWEIYCLQWELSGRGCRVGDIGIGVLAHYPLPIHFHTHTTTNTYPTHPSNLSCREVLENTMWLQIREHWQMSRGLFFWVETECIVRQNLCWQKRKVRGILWEPWKRKEKHFWAPRQRGRGEWQMRWFKNGQ